LYAFLVLFPVSVVSVHGMPQAPEPAVEEIFDGGMLFEELLQILIAADQPLTTEQIAALEPMLGLTPGATAQRGAIIDPEFRERAGEVLTDEQRNALRRAGAAQMLLEEGIEGLRRELAAANVPSLTFDQETQIRSVYDAHVRALNTLLADNGGDRQAVEPQIREIQDQLLLASLKFLNPVQRTAFAGSMSAVDFAALNSDLPEDPNELREYLDDLRSPAGGGGGGGGGRGGGNFGGGRGGGNFGGGGNFNGRMPNRDEIQEIRINENSFTAEQSSQSRGQTRIITRGGAGSYNGDLTFNFADESLDARNAFADSRPPYQRRNFSLNLSGPVIRERLTLTFGLTNNTSEEGDNLQALTPDGLRSDAIARPGEQRNYRVNSTAQLSENNVLSFNVNTFGRRNEMNNVGQERLPVQGNANTQDNFNLNISETAVLSRSFSNEVGFSLQRGQQSNTPNLLAPHIYVQGTLREGGSTNDSNTDFRNYSFDDLLMYTGNAWNIRSGFDANYSRNESESRSNFNGTFTFSSLYDYCGAIDPGFTRAGCAAEREKMEDAQAADPSLDITPQPANTYSVNQGDPFLNTSQFEAATFVQTDWRARPDLTLSFGTRYEWQTNLDDYNNIDPRFGFAYALGVDTVLRGGTGIFHQRLDQDQTRNLLRFNGALQQTLTISNPSYPDPFLSGSGGTISVPSSRRLHADDLAAPYTWNNEVSIETSFDNGMVMTGSYRFIRGIRLLREHNINAPRPECVATMPGGLTSSEQTEFARLCRPSPDEGNIDQLNSTGSSVDHRLRFGFRQRLSFANLNASYEYASSYDDTSDPANNYDLDAEWARSGAPHGLNASVNVRLPLNINADTSFNWSSGSPFTLRTGRDDNFDTANNDRPAGVARNSLTGPGYFQMDMQFSKAIQLRSDRVEGGEGGPIASSGYYGQRTGLRMTIQANISNLLNKVNFQNPSGVLSSPFFGLYTQAREARRVQVQARFDF
jgi:hypothetical protein